jgi:hypothetical protein
MRRIAIAVAALATFAGLALGAAPAYAQSGHFIESGAGAPQCFDRGTTVECTGKVAGLGGTTFEITISATGTASTICTNPAGNRAPGQDTTVTAAGSTGPQPTPRNGQVVFDFETAEPPQPPPTPTCPNVMWTATIVDVAFTTATLSLFEDGVLVDQVVVPVT